MKSNISIKDIWIFSILFFENYFCNRIESAVFTSLMSLHKSLTFLWQLTDRLSNFLYNEGAIVKRNV